MYKQILIAMVVFLSIFPTTFASAVSTNNDMTLYESSNANNISDGEMIDNKMKFTLSGQVKAVRHAKYKDANYTQLEASGATGSNTRVVAYSYTCPGYYITRMYSDKAGKNMMGYAKVYVPVSTFGSLPKGCSSVPEPITPISKPIQESYPDATIATVPTAGNTVEPKKNPAFVEPVAPAKTAVVPPANKVVTPDACGNANPVTTQHKYKGMYPTAAYNHGKGVENYYYVPCDKNDDAFLYVKLQGDYASYGCEGGSDGGITANTVAEEARIINEYGVKTKLDQVDGDHVYTQKLPVLEHPAGYTSVSVETGSNYQICKIVFDSKLLDKDKNGNDRYSCDAGYTLNNDNKCASPNGEEEPEQNFEECAFGSDCTSDFSVMSSSIPIEENPTWEGDTGWEEPEPDLPTCFCPQLAEYAGFEAGFTCCIFECPGLAAIISDFKGFLSGDLVGTANAPAVPTQDAPKLPNIFDILNGVDEKKPQPITTTEDPALETSTFTADDVKGAAGEIEFRDDPTGGFNIVNPLDTLDGNLGDAPTTDLESLNYPGGGKSSDSTVPIPNGSQSDSKASYPNYGDSKAQTPTYSDKAKIPSLGGGK